MEQCHRPCAGRFGLTCRSERKIVPVKCRPPPFGVAPVRRPSHPMSPPTPVPPHTVPPGGRPDQGTYRVPSSLLRMDVTGRLAVAGGLAAALWLGVLWATG